MRKSDPADRQKDVQDFTIFPGVPGSSFLCYLGAHAKILDPMISLPGIYLKFAQFMVKIVLIRGVRGVTKFFLDCNLPIFVTWEPMQNFKMLQ